jgi:eukaryotic-like serine/threonine-protein kinase
MKCPYCGTDNPANEDFCNNCGAYLHEPIAADATVIGTEQKSTSTSSEDNTVMRGQTDSSNSSTTTSTLVPNTNLQAGRYVVTRVLGQGGMGAAVLARDTRVSNKLVVIKELISDETDLIQRQEDVRNFTREVETLARLDHPLIPAVTDSFQERSRYFMVQDYVAGENLEDYMERVKKPMPEQEALTYTSQVLDILQYLAQQQPPIVHRDIKPANIIISSRDKLAHLVDFGIARPDETKPAKRKQTSALGTPGYAPPEQYQGNADARSDLYALAATLHFLLTNRDPRDYPPFNYPRVRTINSHLSLETERMLDRALMLDITKRYQNAAAMKHDIDEILLHDFHTSSDGSIYLRGTSGTLAPSSTGTHPASPTRSGRTGRAEPISPVPPSYEAGLRSLPRSESAPYREPTYARSWLDEPSSGPYQQQQMQQPRDQQRQMFMPPVQHQPQSADNRFILLSFVFLLIVLAVIAGVFFLLPLLSSTAPF